MLYEIAKEANRQFEAMNFYRNQYNSINETERNEMSTGGRTVGQYILDNFHMAEKRFNCLTAQINAASC